MARDSFLARPHLNVEFGMRNVEMNAEVGMRNVECRKVQLRDSGCALRVREWDYDELHVVTAQPATRNALHEI